jgi:hypothetical protein
VNSKIVDARERTPDSSPGRAAIRQGARAGRRLPTSCLSSSLRPSTLRLVRPEVRANFPEAKTDAHALAMSLIIKAANKGEIATSREIRQVIEGKTRYR